MFETLWHLICPTPSLSFRSHLLHSLLYLLALPGLSQQQEFVE
jgi:hypothetical protein